MLKEIILKEVHEQIISFKSLITFVVVILLFGINGLVFQMEYKDKLKNFNSIQNATLSALKDGASVFSKLVMVKQKHVKPPSKLSFISYAEEDKLPNAAEFDAFRLYKPQYIKKNNRFFNAFGSIDWSNVLLFFMSFICLSFGYNAISGEKTKGTLRLALSNNISRWKILAGKITGIFIVIIIPLIIGILVDILIVTALGISLSGMDLSKIAYFFLLTVLFVLFNILLGVLISTLTSRPSVSLSIALLTWIILNIAVPNVSWLFAKELKPVGPLAQAQRAHQKKTNEIWDSDKYYGGWNGNWAGKPPHEKVFKRAALVKALEELDNETWQKQVNAVFDQTNSGITLSKISPYSLFRFMGETVSDNGYQGFTRFYGQLRSFHQVYNDFLLNKDKADKESYHLVVSEPWSFRTFMSNKPVAYDEVPKFEYKTAGIVETLTTTLPDLAILLIWNVALFAWAFFAFVRYDVR